MMWASQGGDSGVNSCADADAPAAVRVPVLQLAGVLRLCAEPTRNRQKKSHRLRETDSLPLQSKLS